MDRKTLVAAVNALETPYHNEAEKLYATIKMTLDDVLIEVGINKIAKVNYSYGDSAEIEVERPGKSYGHTITIYFFEHYWDNMVSNKRKVELNVGTFGSFDATMQAEVNFYIVAGALAKNLSNLQEKFNAIDFVPYVVARRAYNKAKRELENYDNEVKAAEKQKKENEIAAKFVVGAKLRVGKNYDGKPIYDNIEKVTNKRIYLKHDFGTSTNKAKAIELIMNGKWEFAA